MMSGRGCVAYTGVAILPEPIFVGWPNEIMIVKSIGRMRRGSTLHQNLLWGSNDCGSGKWSVRGCCISSFSSRKKFLVLVSPKALLSNLGLVAKHRK
jgi:hypothetical protein